MQPHGPWRIVASQQVYRDPWITVRKDDVLRPDGLPGTHCVVHLKPGVSVLALDIEGQVHLTEEFHYGVGRVCLEVVSGGIESDETADDTARRELREELGIEAGRWSSLGVLDPITSVVVSPTALYLAEELRFVATAPEGTEQIRHMRMPLGEALERMRSGEITHGPSCVLILRACLELGVR